MQREIKFRLILDGKIVGYEQHMECSYGISIFHSGDGEEWFNITDSHYISHTDKDEYTGLKDKNGVEIYEGDIFLAVDKPRMLVWSNGAFGYSISCDFKTFAGHNHFKMLMKQIEVIGNIHENPELLDAAEKVVSD